MNHLFKVLGFAWPYFRRYWPRLSAGILLGVLFGFSNASFIWATKSLIERLEPVQAPPPQSAAAAPEPAQPSGRLEHLKQSFEGWTSTALDPWLPRAQRSLDWRQIVGGLLFLPLLVLFRGITGFGSSYCLGWVSERVINDLRVRVMTKLTSLSLDFFHRAKTGDLLTRVSGDTATLQRCLAGGFGDVVKEPVAILSILAFLLVLDWQLTLAAMVFFPLCIVPMTILGRKAKLATRAGVQATVWQSSQLVEVLGGIRVIKAFNLENVQLDRFRRVSQTIMRSNLRTLRAKELVNPIIETVSVIGLGALILFVTVQQRAMHDIVGFMTGLVLFYTPVKKLAALHVLFEQTSVGLDRLLHILAEAPSVRETPNPSPLTTFQNAITFQNVQFAYDDRPVLQDFTLSIPRGTRLGIAGESGAGKSTLVNLLLRFYDPVAGQVLIDQHNLRDVGLDDLRRLLALVSQEVVIFDATVAENIAAGRPGATAADVESAARAAYAHDFIARLPQGYDTPLGERGASLSVGQRQRISIARAFIRNAPILLLDEATAALDAQAEAEVQSAIERLEENRTVLCVAHRLSTLANMDRIVVLSQGRILEQGTFNELLRAGGTFADMARRQGILPQT